MKTIFYWLFFFTIVNLNAQNTTVAIYSDCSDEKIIDLINDHIKQQPQVKTSFFCPKHNLFIVRVSSAQVEIKDQFINNIKTAFNQYIFDYKDITDPNFVNVCLVNEDIKEKIKFNE